ncbi:MAG: helix-turn-helix transcriptional regulator [Alistipes sp.]|nr:helix-turn-helix transcriptional regulator [Alistipes sp.]
MQNQSEGLSPEVIQNRDEYFTIGLVYEGVKMVYFRGETYSFSARDLFCLGSASYRVVNYPSPYQPYKEVAITFSREELEEMGAWLMEAVAGDSSRRSVRGVEFVGGCKADSLTLGIFNSLRNTPFAPSFTKRQSLLKMLAESTDGLVVRMALSNLDGRRSLFESVVRDNCYHHTSLDELATQCRCSRSSFKEMFHRCYDTSPYHYFLARRLEKAQMLLSTTRFTIAEISDKCEFNSPSHFARIFRSRFSVSPSEYRRLQRNSR